MDVDTERKVTPVTPSKKIYPAIDSMIIVQNGAIKYFEYDMAKLEIDTCLETFYIKMKLHLTNGEYSSSDFSKIRITDLFINLDSVGFANRPITLIGDSLAKAYSRYKLSRGASMDFDTIIFTDNGRNKSEITFAIDNVHREVWSNLETYIYDYRYDVIKINGNDSISVQKDSLVISGKFHFKY
jgi:hypothetical protein